jgi:hypothetical protein
MHDAEAAKQGLAERVIHLEVLQTRTQTYLCITLCITSYTIEFAYSLLRVEKVKNCGT